MPRLGLPHLTDGWKKKKKKMSRRMGDGRGGGI